MALQPSITISGMESDFSSAHGLDMLTANEIREELIRQLDNGTLTGAAVARHLGIAPARVTEMRKGERQVQHKEMRKLAGMLGLLDTEPVRVSYDIPNLGKVAQGVWLEESHSEAEKMEKVTYDRMQGDPPPTDLFAVTPEGESMNLRFMPGTQLICRKVPFGSATYTSGDYVIAQRKAHDLVEMTVKRLEIDDEGQHWLCSESSDPRFQEPWLIGAPSEDHHDDNEVCILAKVIRAVQDFERRSK